jgi:hypothetical protein
MLTLNMLSVNGEYLVDRCQSLHSYLFFVGLYTYAGNTIACLLSAVNTQVTLNNWDIKGVEAIISFQILLLVVTWRERCERALCYRMACTDQPKISFSQQCLYFE